MDKNDSSARAMFTKHYFKYHWDWCSRSLYCIQNRNLQWSNGNSY